MPINSSMSYRIRCYTLFDITNTGITSRSKSDSEIPNHAWLKKRNTQCNFDTILQVISLRSQPEIIEYPAKSPIPEDHRFGTQQILHNQDCWSFQFYIQHSSVFANNIDELGLLYDDCDNVPMINCYDNTTVFLNTTPEQRNIYFEIQHEY